MLNLKQQLLHKFTLFIFTMKKSLFLFLIILFATPAVLLSQDWKNFTPAGFGIKLQAPADFSGSPAGDDYIVRSDDIQLVISNYNDQAKSISDLEDILTVNGALTGMESDWNIESIGSDKIPGFNALKLTGTDENVIIDLYLLYIPGNPGRCTYIEASYIGENLKSLVEKIIFSCRPV